MSTQGQGIKGLSHGITMITSSDQTLKWGIGLGAEAVIVLSSLFGFLLIPLMKKKWFPTLLTGLVGLAVGTLAGTGALTLVPDALNIVENEKVDNKAYIWKSCAILGGLYFFFITERLMKIAIKGKHTSQSQCHNHTPQAQCHNQGSHSSSPNPASQPTVFCTEMTPHCNADGIKQMTAFERQTSDANEAALSTSSSQITLVSAKCTEENYDNAGFYIGDDLPTDLPKSFELKTAVQVVEAEKADRAQGKVPLIAWVLSIGEGFHHIIDGIIVGVAFSQNVFGGISIAVSILCEEFTHKLGDYAILLSAGMQPCKAMLFNFLQSACNIIGFIAGMFIGETKGAAGWMYAIAAGMFIYLAYIEMVPELDKCLEDQPSRGQAFKVFVVQNIGIMLGFAITLVLGIYGDQIQFQKTHPESVHQTNATVIL